MGSLERRIAQLEELYRTGGNPEEDPARSGVRARMRAFLDELAAAKREGREISPEARATLEAWEESRGRGSSSL